MSAPSTFHISVRHRIWRVTLDGVFYGDYRSLGDATDGAEVAAAGLRADGRIVTIVRASASGDTRKYAEFGGDEKRQA